MSKEIDQIRAEGEEAIEDVDLSTDETRRLKELDEIIKRIGNQISELSMRESITNDPIYDATLRNLIYESQIYQQEYEALLKSQDESNYMKKNLETLIKHLQTIEDYETFNASIFKEIVESGIFHEDYEIEFIFKCGIKRKAYGWRRGKNPVELMETGIEQEIDYKNSL
jgi:site-specific DNA recombinase